MGYGESAGTAYHRLIRVHVAVIHSLPRMMIIAQLTDTHLGAEDTTEPKFHARRQNLAACIADINALDPLPDAVIHTGDLTQHGRAEEFAVARALLARLKPPLYIIPGNRDGRAGWRKAFAADGFVTGNRAYIHYAIDRHSVRLVAVDSLADDKTSKGDFCTDRLAALDTTLAAAPEHPTALFMHHPPFDVPTAPDPFAYHRRDAVQDLADVLARHSQVVHLFAGHMHRPWLTRIAGVTAGTVPSVAVDLRYGHYPETMAGRPVYQVHRYEKGCGFASQSRLLRGVDNT